MADEMENVDVGYEVETDAPVEGESQVEGGELEQSSGEEEIDPMVSLREENEKLRRESELERSKAALLKDLFDSRGGNQAPMPQKPAEADPFANLADDDLITAGDYKRTLSQIRKSSEEQIRSLRMEFSETRARDKHADYDDVIETYFADIVRQNPGLLETVMSHKDPAESAYRLAMTHPNFQANVQKATAQKIVKKIQTNANAPKTLGARGGGMNRTPTSDPYSQMSDDEFERHMNKVLDR